MCHAAPLLYVSFLNKLTQISLFLYNIPASEGRKLKFPEPGYYETAAEFEEVITSYFGYSGFLTSIDYPHKYWDDDLYHTLLVGEYHIKSTYMV